jgi:hypothetical protein
MKALAVILPLALATSVFGQAVQRNFGSVVFPGGTASTSPSITRSFGSVVFPGGMRAQPVYAGAPAIGARSGFGALTPNPAGRGQSPNVRRTPPTNGRGTRLMPSYIYAFPVYVGVYDNSYAAQEPAAPQQEAAPPQPAVPVMIQVGPDGGYTTTAQHQTSTIYQPEQQPETAEAPGKAADSPHYLLAFKDHSIYSAVAYWADGDTLHYFTTGNTHNQASMSLIDRELTERLNRELGIDFSLPPAK